MIKQSLANNDSILEKKFKILRTSIMLGNVRNREETMREYEETARDIDKIKRDVYEEILASKTYTTTSLEEERDRLKDLIDYIENRVKERNEFIDDYIKITNNFLDGLDKVSQEDELSEYKNRLGNICEYLDNCSEIEKLNKKIKELRDDLEEKYENKANNELINEKLEDSLIDEFNKVVASNEYYSELNYTDIEEELNKLEGILSDKKDVMNTFTSSYEALKNAGISGVEREEYLSYVQDARVDYYNELEKSFILNIYKLVLDKISDYDRLYEKRQRIDKILDDRDKVRKELEITSRDDIQYFADLCREQFSIIKSQKINMENIDRLILEISNCEDKLENLDRANSRDEIVELLKEFAVKSPEIEKIELPKEEKVYEEVITRNADGSLKPSNVVVRISEPIKMNVKTASDTAKLVMKKVVIVLEPKKFNGKKDKIKEAEKELEERKRQERLLEQERKIQEDAKKLDKEKESIFIDNSSSGEGVLDIKLDTKDVEDKDIKDTVETNEVKINIPDSKDVSIPTEIFIEEPSQEETVDLFKETDPFLDDNMYEINNNNLIDDNKSNMPKISNIGTVKPNNMLSKIDNVVKENDNIILPTMGLSSKEEESVPIVSENYIS